MKYIQILLSSLFVGLFLIQTPGYSQEYNLAIYHADSLVLVDGPWHQEIIGRGVTFKQIRFESKELFASNQCLSILEIAPGSLVRFGLAAEPLLTTTEDLAKKEGALAAVNGSFFKFTDEPNTIDFNSVDYLRIDNRMLADNTYSSSGQRLRHQEGAVAILDGVLYIVKATSERGWERYLLSDHVLCSGPLLVIDGRIEPLRMESFYTTRHPRTVVAKKRDGTVLLFVVDGRHAKAEGMSLEEIQKTLLWLGAVDILNFDGGGSSTMYIDGKGENGVVNHPCDNREFDHLGSRKVANALYITF